MNNITRNNKFTWFVRRRCYITVRHFSYQCWNQEVGRKTSLTPRHTLNAFSEPRCKSVWAKHRTRLGRCKLCVNCEIKYNVM